MSKKILIIFSIIFVMTISIVLIRISNDDIIISNEEFSENELRKYKDQVLDIAQENDDLDWIGCGVQKGENAYYVNLELRQYDGVDYEALKEIIYKEIGVKFPLQFELIPMPESPSIEGIVRHIEKAFMNSNGLIGKLLVISDTKFIGQYKTPDALDITISDQTLIVDKNGDSVTFDQIMLGTRIESYFRGMTLTTYPGQQGSEKIVVDLDYQTKRIEDLVDPDIFQYKFKGADVSEPYYFAFGYEQSIAGIGPYNHIWLHMEEGLEYYDLDTLETVYYEGGIIIYIRSNNEEILKNPYIFENTMVNKDFMPTIEDIDSDGYYEILIPYYENNQWLEKSFKILENRIIRDTLNDKNE